MGESKDDTLDDGEVYHGTVNTATSRGQIYANQPNCYGTKDDTLDDCRVNNGAMSIAYSQNTYDGRYLYPTEKKEMPVHMPMHVPFVTSKTFTAASQDDINGSTYMQDCTLSQDIHRLQPTVSEEFPIRIKEATKFIGKNKAFLSESHH